MRVTVKEGRTGTFTFGAGYSSLERATVFAQIQQTNFDLFNARSVFQGDGEKFSIRVSIGELSNEAVISFEEPYLFQKVLALGFSLFREQSSYVSTYYQELQEGGFVNLRKPLFGLFQGILTYQYEIVDIYNVSASASPIISLSGGLHDISSIAFEIVRDTRDKIISPTSGNRIDITTTVAGGPLGGTDSFYKFEFHGSQNFKVFDTQEQVLELVAYGGVDRQLRRLRGPALLRRVLPRRAPDPARVRVQRGQPARHLTASRSAARPTACSRQSTRWRSSTRSGPPFSTTSAS